MGEYLKNLTYQVFSQENNNIFLSFTYGSSLIHSILEAFKRKEQNEVEKSKIISEKIKDKLDIKFDVVETPAMKIQLGDEESEIEHEPNPTEFSTPLKIEKIDEIYDWQKSDFLKIAIKLNQIDFESATEVADSENEALIQEIINPMPGLVVDDNISVNTQFSFQNSDLDTSFASSDTLKTRLDDILQDARTKISSISYPPEAIPEDIPNDPLYPLSQIKTEDIYIDESLRDILYPGGEELYFPQPSTDDRKDFEINIPESEIIIFKSLSLTFASVEKKRIKNHIK